MRMLCEFSGLFTFYPFNGKKQENFKVVHVSKLNRKSNSMEMVEHFWKYYFRIRLKPSIKYFVDLIFKGNIL